MEMNPEDYLTSDDYMSLMALELNMPEDSGCQGILENIKFLNRESRELKEQYSKAVQDINQRDWERTSHLKEIKELKEQLDEQDDNIIKVAAEKKELRKEYKKLKEENKKLMEENTKLAKDYANIARPRRESPPRNIDGDVVLRLKRENDDLKKQIDEIASQNIEVARKNIENINQIKKLKENLKLSEDKVCELTHDLNKETERMSAADESMRFMGWVWDGEEWICQ